MSTRPHPRWSMAPIAIAMIFVVAIAAALLYAQAAQLGAANARDHLQTSRIAQRVIEEHARDDLRLRAQLITGDQAFVGYVTQSLGSALPGMAIDTASIVDLLVERRDQLGLSVAAVLDRDGQLVVATEHVSDRKTLGQEPLFVRAKSSHGIASGLWNDGERLLNVAILPLSAGGSDAYLLVGMPVDHAMASAIAEIAGTQVAVLAKMAGQRLVVASTLDPAAEKTLRDALATSGQATVTLDGRDYLTAVLPLLGSKDGDVVALAPTGPVGDVMSARLWPMWLGMGLLVALALAAAAWWRVRVAAPTRSLSSLLARAAGGDYHLQVADAEAGALGPIATAFNRLMEQLRGVPR